MGPPRLKQSRLFLPAPLRQLLFSDQVQLAADRLPVHLPPVALSLPGLAHLPTVGHLVLFSLVLPTECPWELLVLSVFLLRPCWYNHGKIIAMLCSICIFVDFEEECVTPFCMWHCILVLYREISPGTKLALYVYSFVM